MIKKNVDRDRSEAFARTGQSPAMARILDFGNILKFRREQPGGLRANWRRDEDGVLGRVWFAEK